MPRRSAPPRGPDAKARSSSGPVLGLTGAAATRQRRAKASGVKRRTPMTGRVVEVDHTPRGSRSGLVIGTTGPQGGISVDPGVSFAYKIRRMLHPIRIAPVTITDAAGRVVGQIVVDPVTGKRTRVTGSP